MSPQYLSPGVYVEEVDRGSKPIEGVGTSLAGFVGFAAKGPVNKPTFVANWTQFSQVFGDFLPGAFLAHAVYGYFSGSYVRGSEEAMTRIQRSPIHYFQRPDATRFSVDSTAVAACDTFPAPGPESR